MWDPVSSVALAVSVLALAGAVLSYRATGAELLQSLSKTVRTVEDELRHLRTIEFPRVEADAQSVLEAATTKFDSADKARRSATTRLQQAEAGGNGGVPPWLDPAVPEAERRKLLGASMRAR